MPRLARPCPQVALTYAHRAHAYWRKGDHDQAITDADRAIHIDPKCAMAYYSRGRAQKDVDKAITDFSQAILTKPRWVPALGLRDSAYMKKRQYKLAIGDYTAIIEQSSGVGLAHTYKARAVAYELLGTPDGQGQIARRLPGLTRPTGKSESG